MAKPNVQIYRSFDMGFDPDPAYCLWIAHLGNRFIAFKEKLWLRTIAPDIADDIRAESEGMRVVTTFCDPTLDINTGADVVTIKDRFENRGVPMECSVNSRELFAHAIHTALGQEVEPGVPKLQIYQPGCPYLCKTLPKQRFDDKHPLRLARHKHDHAAVALAYFLISSGAMDRMPDIGNNGSRSNKLWLQPKAQSRFVLGSQGVRDHS